MGRDVDVWDLKRLLIGRSTSKDPTLEDMGGPCQDQQVGWHLNSMLALGLSVRVEFRDLM